MKHSTKLKIGLVLDDSLDRNDGVQQYVRSLGAWLVRQGHTVHFLAGQTRSGGKAVHSLSRNIGVKFNGNRLSMPLPASARAIKTLLAREKYDVLHIQMPYSPLMAGKVIRLASMGTAVVGTFHILPIGGLQRYGNRALGLVQKRQLRRLDAICSVSAPAQKFAKTHYGLASRVIPNMIDAPAWHSAMHPHAGRIVFLGRLVPRKGCAELLWAVLELPEPLRNNLEVLIAGDGPERQKLEKFAGRHKLRQVVFLGYIDERHKRDLLASAQLAVFPSLGGESFGIVLIEAMAAGAGVVLGGNNPGYQSVLAAWPKVLFNPRDNRAFGRRLRAFLEDEKLRARLHAQQQAAVRQYDVDIVGGQIMKLYAEALLQRRQEMR